MNSENKFIIGKKASLSKLITEDEVRQFAKISLDTNPAHLDAQYAATTMFKKTNCPWNADRVTCECCIGDRVAWPGSHILVTEL